MHICFLPQKITQVRTSMYTLDEGDGDIMYLCMYIMLYLAICQCVFYKENEIFYGGSGKRKNRRATILGIMIVVLQNAVQYV